MSYIFSKVKPITTIDIHKNSNNANDKVWGYYNYSELNKFGNAGLDRYEEKTLMFGSVVRIGDVNKHGTVAQRRLLDATIDVYSENYVGEDVRICFGNLYELIPSDNINHATGETYNARRCIDGAFFVAIYDTELVMLEIRTNNCTTVEQFYGSAWGNYINKKGVNRGQRIDCVFAAKEVATTFIPNIGDHQILPIIAGYGKVSKAQRDKLVIELYQKGFIKKSIAREVSISRPTVDRILKKAGL